MSFKERRLSCRYGKLISLELWMYRKLFSLKMLWNVLILPQHNWTRNFSFWFWVNKLTEVTNKTELYSVKLTLAHKLSQDSQPLDWALRVHFREVFTLLRSPELKLKRSSTPLVPIWSVLVVLIDPCIVVLSMSVF